MASMLLYLARHAKMLAVLYNPVLYLKMIKNFLIKLAFLVPSQKISHLALIYVRILSLGRLVQEEFVILQIRRKIIVVLLSD